MMFRLALVCLTTALQFTAFAGSDPVQVPAALQKVFVPIGFDDNDLGQVMVAGTFSDTCHKLGPARVQVDSASSTVYIEQTALKYSEICLRMIVPFVNVVDLGILRSGNYKIVDVFSKENLGSLSVLTAKTSAPDDFLYAPVSDADIVVSDDGLKHNLVLKGMFSSRCSSMKEIRVHQYSDTVVVQPIMDYRETDRDCAFTKVRFVYVHELDQKVVGAHLLHVRVTNGRAVNKLVDLP